MGCDKMEEWKLDLGGILCGFLFLEGKYRENSHG
jgi:hypothetical protein